VFLDRGKRQGPRRTGEGKVKKKLKKKKKKWVKESSGAAQHGGVTREKGKCPPGGSVAKKIVFK